MHNCYLLTLGLDAQAPVDVRQAEKMSTFAQMTSFHMRFMLPESLWYIVTYHQITRDLGSHRDLA